MSLQQDGNSPLHIAAIHDLQSLDDCKDNKGLLLEFIRLGADINATNNEGYTPLHLSVEYSGPYRPLLEHGCDTSILTKVTTCIVSFQH
jgi:ankyrin repeat protein